MILGESYILIGEKTKGTNLIKKGWITASISKNENDIIEAKKLDDMLQPVHDAMFVESNPSPVKFAAKLMNLCDDEVRLPLVKVTDKTQKIVRETLQSTKLI